MFSMMLGINIVAAATVDREFWCIHASFELTLKGPGMLWGLHCAPCVSLWGTFGVSLGHLGRSWAHFGATWRCIRVPWGCLGTALGMPWDFSGPHWKKSVRGNPHRKPMALKYRACAQKQTRWNTHTVYGGDGETVHELQFRPPVPHAPGIRMT